MLNLGDFERKSTNIFSPKYRMDAGIVLSRPTSPNTTQNKHRGSWGISTEVDLRDLYLTSPEIVYMAKIYFSLRRGPKLSLTAPTIVEFSVSGADKLGIIWVNNSGVPLVSGTYDSDRGNGKIYDFWQIFCKNTKKKLRKTFVISPGS